VTKKKTLNDYKQKTVPQKNYFGKSIFEKYLLCKIFSKNILNRQDKDTSEKCLKIQNNKVCCTHPIPVSS